MSIDNTKVVNLNLKKEERILDFSDFQKQNLKFDINKLQEAYNQIIKTKKFWTFFFQFFSFYSIWPFQMAQPTNLNNCWSFERLGHILSDRLYNLSETLKILEKYLTRRYYYIRI